VVGVGRVRYYKNNYCHYYSVVELDRNNNNRSRLANRNIRCYTNYVGRYPLARSCTTSYNNNAIYISIIIIIIIIVVISYTSYYNNCIYIYSSYLRYAQENTFKTKTRKKHNLYRARRYNESWILFDIVVLCISVTAVVAAW